MVVGMIQYVALLGSIREGLSDIHHPVGNSLYVVRADQTFLYVGCTVQGEWTRIRTHIRTASLFGRGVLDYWPNSATWRVEVCNFGGEPGAERLEQELIRYYHPLFNESYNTGRPRTVAEQFALRNRALMGPACLRVLDAGWPSFQDIVPETLQDYPRGRRLRYRTR